MFRPLLSLEPSLVSEPLQGKVLFPLWFEQTKSKLRLTQLKLYFVAKNREGGINPYRSPFIHLSRGDFTLKSKDKGKKREANDGRQVHQSTGEGVGLFPREWGVHHSFLYFFVLNVQSWATSVCVLFTMPLQQNLCIIELRVCWRSDLLPSWSQLVPSGCSFLS